jgi:hypothetical protein
MESISQNSVSHRNIQKYNVPLISEVVAGLSFNLLHPIRKARGDVNQPCTRLVTRPCATGPPVSLGGLEINNSRINYGRLVLNAPVRMSEKGVVRGEEAATLSSGMEDDLSVIEEGFLLSQAGGPELS